MVSPRTTTDAWPDRRLLDRIGLAVPIIQAPLAGASDARLAMAASRGGSLGSIPCAMLTADQARREVTAFRASADGPLNLNFFCHVMPAPPDETEWRARLAPYYAELRVDVAAPPPPLRLPFDEAMCALVEEVRPEVVSFHFGLPDQPLLDRVLATGAFVIGNATNVAEARWLAARGCGAVIAQGWEAGGHTGAFLEPDAVSALGLFALLPQVVDAVDVPVIAAGGIGDARGIVAALALGAAAVQLGTAYLTAPESLASAPHRAALASEAAERTVFTNLLSGGLARGLPNRLMDELGPVSAEAPPYPHASTALAPLRKAAEAAGRGDFSPLWAGQAAPLARAEPAEALTARLAREALDLLARLGKGGGDA
jgi:nitronate monooxygenase